MSTPAPAEPFGQTSTNEPVECPECGAVHNPRKCQGHADDAKREAYKTGGVEARNATTGQPRQCRAWPLKGQRVCGSHGGSARQNVNAAEQRAAEQAVEQRVTRLLGQAVPHRELRHPLEELADLAAQITTWKDVLAGMVAKLEDVSIDGLNVRPEIALFERALGRCGQLLLGMGKLDLDNRLIRLHEQLGQRVGAAVKAVLDALDLTVEQRRIAEDELQRQFAALTDGAPLPPREIAA